MFCLDIPVPRCVKELLREPPVRWPRDEDVKVLNLIKGFGEEFRRPENEINHACNLASGPSDLVVILERPHSSQNYNVDFHEFVARCETLKRVDELIRFSSKGTRSIHTVTVIDAFSFKPDENTPIPSERCFQLTEEILKMKMPKVVLCCWNRPCDRPFVAQFKSFGVGAWPIRDQVEIKGSALSIIRSFHPAAAVCHDASQKTYCRMLLICHFALAFAELAGSTKVPEWVRAVCDESSREFK